MRQVDKVGKVDQQHEADRDGGDDVPTEPTVVCDPPPGSTFFPGTTTVTCVATDSKNRVTTVS